MTLHWWMHWFWITLLHTVVAIPLLLPGTLSAPSQEQPHGLFAPPESSPVPNGDTSWNVKEPSPPGVVGTLKAGTSIEQVATKNQNGSPPVLTLQHEGLTFLTTESSVIGKEHAHSAKEAGLESTSEASKEVPLFLEEESEREWGGLVDPPPPRQPFFLTSPELAEAYEKEIEDEGIHESADVPWLSPAVPQKEVGTTFESPTVVPSQELPSTSESPWPANKSSDKPAADAVHVREGKAIGVSHIDQQPKQEHKQSDEAVGSDVTVSSTQRPVKFEVESSPVKSSSNSNATSISVKKEDDVKKENITKNSSSPLAADSSSSNSDVNDTNTEEQGEMHSLPVIVKEKNKKEDEKVLIGPKVEKEMESKKTNSSIVENVSSNQSKPAQNEEVSPPLEVPTAVPVREGIPVQSPDSEEKKERDAEVRPSDKDEVMATAADVPSSVHQGRMTAPRALDAASIVGISLGSVLLVGAVAGGIGFVLYRRSLYANKPQTLNDKCSNPDSSGYIDDTLRVSSACSSSHGQRPKPTSRGEVTKNGGQGRRGIGRGGGRGGRGGGGEGGKERRPSEPKENSEEMYSLDNDSFLNSLEAMTIQNYWTDSVKHTKL